MKIIDNTKYLVIANSVPRTAFKDFPYTLWHVTPVTTPF